MMAAAAQNKKKKNRKRKNKEGKMSTEELNNLDLDQLCSYIENKGEVAKNTTAASLSLAKNKKKK